MARLAFVASVPCNQAVKLGNLEWHVARIDFIPESMRANPPSGNTLISVRCEQEGGNAAEIVQCHCVPTPLAAWLERSVRPRPS
jgi:hypothetical protein